MTQQKQQGTHNPRPGEQDITREKPHTDVTQARQQRQNEQRDTVQRGSNPSADQHPGQQGTQQPGQQRQDDGSSRGGSRQQSAGNQPGSSARTQADRSNPVDPDRQGGKQR